MAPTRTDLWSQKMSSSSLKGGQTIVNTTRPKTGARSSGTGRYRYFCKPCIQKSSFSQTCRAKSKSPKIHGWILGRTLKKMATTRSDLWGQENILIQIYLQASILRGWPGIINFYATKIMFGHCATTNLKQT